MFENTFARNVKVTASNEVTSYNEPEPVIYIDGDVKVLNLVDAIVLAADILDAVWHAEYAWLDNETDDDHDLAHAIHGAYGAAHDLKQQQETRRVPTA
jgi:hypothetical protein